MQGCVQNGGTKIIQTKHVYSHKIVSLSHYQVMKEGQKEEKKEKGRSCNVQSPLMKNVMCE
jgi:hypothetical protein